MKKHPQNRQERLKLKELHRHDLWWKETKSKFKEQVRETEPEDPPL